MNLLLIDDTILDIQIFINGINDKTKYVTYNYENTFEEIENKISELTVDEFNIIGFVFCDRHINTQIFLEYEFFNKSEKILNFMKHLIEKYKIKIIDFLACNLLLYAEWKEYFELLNKMFDIAIRASNDKTGNLISGGDWILETTNINIKDIYFNDKINLWKNVLDYLNPIIMNILTDETTNNMYISGKSEYGNDGSETSYIYKLTNYSLLNDKFVDKKIINICIGDNNQVMLLTDEKYNNLYCIGNNNDNMFGITNNFNIFLFENICMSPLSDIILNKKITTISCGSNHTAIIDSNNVLYVCGSNENGKAGLGNKSKVTTFTKIDSLAGISINVNCGNDATAVITNELVDNLYTCGNNNCGKLGNGTTDDQDEFCKLELNKKVINAKFGAYHLIMTTNELVNNFYVCGSNSIGQFGNDTLDGDTHPTFTNVSINNKNIFDIYAGQMTSIVLTTELINNMYVTGYNTNGGFGLENPNDIIQKFTRVKTDTKIIKTGYSLYTNNAMIGTSFNKLYSAGTNNFGELGTQKQIYNNFTEIIFNKNIDKILCSNNASFVLSDEPKNNFYVCGGNTNTTFGSIDPSIFNKTKFNKTVLKSLVGYNNSFYITNEPDNNLYYCGYNFESRTQFFNNKITLFKSPSIYKKKVIDISLGNYHCVILTNELKNNIYGIGNSHYGLPTSNTEYSFQNIGLSESSHLYNKRIIKISCGPYFTHAITSDYKLYSTGVNDNGQLGLGDRINRTNFETTMSNVIDVSAGNTGTLILTNASPNLYSCGCDIFGELGRGKGSGYIQTTFFLLSHSALANKKIIGIYASYFYSYVLTSDETNNCYSSGYNGCGQLGLNDTNNRSTFTLVQNALLNKKVTSVNTYSYSAVVTTSEKINNIYVCGTDATGLLGLNNHNLDKNPYYTTFQKVTTFGYNLIKINNYQFTKKMYLNVPIDITIYSVLYDIDLNLENISIAEERITFHGNSNTLVKSYKITPFLTTFDKHVSFTIYPYTKSFEIYITVNSIDYLATTDKSNFIYYKFKDNITIYTKKTGIINVYFIY